MAAKVKKSPIFLRIWEFLCNFARDITKSAKRLIK